MLGTSVLELESQLTHCRTELAKITHDNKSVLEEYNAFGNTLLQAYVAGEGFIDIDLRKILDGIFYAAEAHHGQSRKNASKTPYIIHPIAVAHLLANIGKARDPDILIAALLHDAIEDTNVTLGQVERSFGKRVAGFVAEVTDDPELHWKEQRQQQIDHAHTLSAGAAQIKLADKLHNLCDVIRDPPLKWTPDRIQAYVGWAQQVVDHLPWVNAGLKSKLDDLFTAYWKQQRNKTL